MTLKDPQKPSVGLIILAAGASVRLGQAKQLLKFDDQTLIFKMTRAGLRSVCFPVQVVLGANYFQVLREIENLPVYIDINTDWSKGMSSSISFGLKKIIQAYPHLDAVIIMVCDQPYVTAQTINDLVFKYVQSDSRIVASSYNGLLGVPALFDKSLFSDLLQLSGDAGARKLIKQFDPRFVQNVPFEQGKIDIDTYEDYFLALKKTEGE